MLNSSEKMFTSLLFIILIIHECVGPPTTQQKQDDNSNNNNNNTTQSEPGPQNIDDLGLEYGRYLKEVVQTLEKDKEFQEKLSKASEVDIRTGKVAAELSYVNHNVRTKLDELKRTEIQRLKQLVKQSDFLEMKKKGLSKSHFDVVGHLDHTNEDTFEVYDLHRLITKLRLDLEEVDKRRREEFKEYEMQKKFEVEQNLKTMDEKHKKEYEEELEAQKKKHQQHEPLHHPGSRAQLEEVWEKDDHMERQEFNPKTFFHLHDLDGNGYLDEMELKTLFLRELEKMYQSGIPEDDMKEREEEMERMREHVFSEADTNKDRLISYEEFLKNTQSDEFSKDEGWETIDQKQQFSDKEYEEFKKHRQEEIQRLIEQGVLQPYPQDQMGHPQYGAVHPPEYQQHPGQPAYVQPPHPNMINQPPQYQYGSQVQYHPPQPNAGQVHPNQIPQQQQQYHQQQQQYQQQQQQYQQHQQYPHVSDGGNAGAQHHPNQAQQAQYQNQVPPQAQYQIPPQQQHHPQQQYQQPISNEIPKQQPPINQMGTGQQQQIPSGQQQVNNNNNVQPPQYHQPQQQQAQSNNIPQQQYQSKYEPHSNQIGTNDKTQHQNIPK